MGLLRLPTRFRRRPPRKPWEPRFVFVVTYGRSGSTLLQGLVNALPGALLRGENNFYLLHIFRAWADLRSFRRQYAKDADRGPRSAFYGLDETSMRDFVHMARRLVIRQLLGSVDRGDVELLGFKEVLWHRVEPEETAQFFTFLEALFPGAVYLLNQRAHDAVASSGFWANRHPDEINAAVRRVEEIQDFLRSTRPQRVLDTRYELFTSDDEHSVQTELAKIATFLTGACDERALLRMRETLAVGHGPRPFGRSRQVEPRRLDLPAGEAES